MLALRTGLVALLALVVPGLAAAEPAPITFRHFAVDIAVAEDGTSVSDLHYELAAGNEGGAKSIAVQYANYIEALESLELREAYTLKADGRRIPVAESGVRTQLAPGSPGLPMYTDSKRINVVFPDVQAGDSVVLTWHKTVHKPVFPGHFAQSSVFTPLLPWEDARVTITAPLDRKLQTEAFGPVQQVSEVDGKRVYVWTYAAPAVVEDHSVLAPIDRVPRLFASTFRDWADLGQSWAALVEPKLEVTPAIRALADQITAGIEDKRGQTEAIYGWVSRNIRWVGLYVGDGSFVPHAAGDVLASRYGDCKDQVVLTIALLRAKGIGAEPALIHAGPSYKLSGPATYSGFNHVITYVPLLDLYMDTTARGAPFGTLPFALYGKQTLHARLEGAALRRVPALAPGVATMRQRTVATLDGTGQITGTTVTEATGPFATSLRGTIERLQASGPQRAASEQLRALGEAGTGELELPSLDRVVPEIGTSGRFTLNKQPDILEGDDFHMPSGLALLPHPGDGPLGPLAVRNLPASEPTPCYAAEQSEDVSLTLPPGRKLTRLPRDRLVETDAFRYRSHWSVADGVVRVERTLSSRIGGNLCEGSVRASAARVLTMVRHDQEARLSLDDD